MAQLYKLRLTGVPQWANSRNRAGVSVTKTPSYHELSKAQVEAIEADQFISIEEVDSAPEGVTVATSDETTTVDEQPDRLTELKNMKRAELEAVASDAGIENPGDKKEYPNIPTLAQAVVDAEAPADENTLEDVQEGDEEDNPDESDVTTADETTQEDDRANAGDPTLASDENVQPSDGNLPPAPAGNVENNNEDK